MSYNTRRSNAGYGPGQPQQSSASMGQRRPVAANNFVGGQLSGSPAQKPQQQHQRLPVQQQQTGINFRQNQQGGPQQSYQSSYSAQQQGTSTPPAKQEVTKDLQSQPQHQQIQQQQQPKPPNAPIITGANPPAPEPNEEGMDANDESPKKRFWNKGNKLPRAEKIRRRNLRLSKILQPKNAVMILNELVKGCVYNVDEMPVKVDFNQFRGTVIFDGQEFAGTGRTKIAAKNAAAETALKHLVKNKQLHSIVKKSSDENGDEKMDITEEDGSQVMPWSHIASFAMYKLFSTWGEDANLVNKVTPQDIMTSSQAKAAAAAASGGRDPRPAKKMPENAETMNPLMLIHQMCPNAVWEEVGKSGNPPNVLFTFCVNIDGKHYSGTGSSKKIAKRQAAFAACHEVLKVTYPPDVWAPVFLN